MNIPGKKRFCASRRGMVLFLVLGAILLLSIMIMSYNYLVRGKFNETQNLLLRLQAMKTAQGAVNYLTTRLIAESAPTDDTSSITEVRKAFYGSSVGEDLQKWVEKFHEEGLGLAYELIKAAEINEDFDIAFEISASDITSLSSDSSDTAIYFACEKCGYLTLKATVSFSKSKVTEIWTESRPFRVVVPYPVPMTKFTLYVNNADDGSDGWQYNTVQTNSEGTVVSGSKPICLDNGKADSTSSTEVWAERGWVYMGGSGSIYLNRAAGHRKESSSFGQGFHSYFLDAQKPITLVYENLPGTGDTNSLFHFSVARWGFFDALYTEGADDNEIWNKVFTDLYQVHSTDSTKHWYSSCLQLMGFLTAGGRLTPTRVVGNVIDRFIEVGYFTDVNNTPIAALRYVPSALRYKNLLGSSSENSTNTYSKLLMFPSSDIPEGFDDKYGYDANKLLTGEVFDSGSDDKFSYAVVMSKANESDLYNVTANSIIQYSTNSSNNINIPPETVVPASTEMKFAPSFGASIAIEGVSDLPDIDKIVKDDKTLGMNNRVCYVIKESGSKADETLHSVFGSDNRLSLANSVVKLINTDGSNSELKLRDDILPANGGAIVTNCPVTVGTFGQVDQTSTLAVIAENGAITIANSSSSDRQTFAYLVALSETGELKFQNDNQINLYGGLAVNKLDPDNIAGGGLIAYNVNLDPTAAGFALNHFGVAIGPVGGE